MNSPVHVAGSNTNMVNRSKSRKTKIKGKNKPKKKLGSFQTASIPSGPSGAMVAGTAYGAVSGNKKILPITSGVGRTMVVANYEIMAVGSGLTGTGGFNIGGLVLNAGISAQWPWLGSIALSFQKFRFRYLRFLFVPQCATTTPGSVFLYLSYDPDDASPANLAGVTASESSVVGNAWYGGPINPDVAFSKQLSLKDNIYLDVDLGRMTQPWYYVRATTGATSNVVALNGTATGGNGTLALGNAQTYEYTSRPGSIYFGTNGVTNAMVAGNLYMSYVCEFSEPILSSLNT